MSFESNSPDIVSVRRSSCLIIRPPGVVPIVTYVHRVNRTLQGTRFFSIFCIIFVKNTQFLYSTHIMYESTRYTYVDSVSSPTHVRHSTEIVRSSFSGHEWRSYTTSLFTLLQNTQNWTEQRTVRLSGGDSKTVRRRLTVSIGVTYGYRKLWT